jgi:hypothetical protein
MNTIALAPAFGIFLLLSTGTAFAQNVKVTKPKVVSKTLTMTVITPRDYAELEAKIKELDQLPDDAIGNVEVSRAPSEDPSSPNLIIKVERKTGDQKKLVKIDTSQLSLPTTGQVNTIREASRTRATPPKSCDGVPDVDYKHLGISDFFRLTAEYKYVRPDFTITVHKGFEYDRASIPAVLFLVATKDNVGDPGPLIHDFLYRYGGRVPSGQVSPSGKVFWRKEADELLRELMQKCGVRKFRRELVYGVVREVSSRYWRGTDNNN